MIKRLIRLKQSYPSSRQSSSILASCWSYLAPRRIIPCRSGDTNMSAGIRAHLGMAFPHKTVLMFATIAVALLGVLVFVVPKLINVDRYRPEVIAYLGRKTGKQIE